MAYKFNPFSGTFDYFEADTSDITVVANYSALPVANTVSGQFYWCSASQGTSWLPGSLGGTYYSAGLYYSNGVSWEFLDVPYQATQAEVNTGTNTDKFVTPATLANSTQFQFLDVTSSIQTQLNAATSSLGSPLNITNPQTHTGTTVETIMPIVCPNLVGVLATDDVLNLMLYLQATNSANVKTVKFYISDSQDVLLNEVLIGTATGTNGFINTARIEKMMSMTSLTTQLVVAGTTTGISGWGVVMTGLSIDFSSGTKYLVVTFQLALGTETMKLQFAFSQINRKF